MRFVLETLSPDGKTVISEEHKGQKSIVEDGILIMVIEDRTVVVPVERILRFETIMEETDKLELAKGIQAPKPVIEK